MIGTLYGGPLTLPTAVVRVVLAEKSLPFSFVEVPWSAATGYRPVHPMVAKYHPDQKNPVWVDDDAALYDSFLICLYLEDRYGRIGDAPEGAVSRAQSRAAFFDATQSLFPLIERLVHERVYGSASTCADQTSIEQAIAIFIARAEQAASLGQYRLDADTPSLGDLATATLLNGIAFLSGGLPDACSPIKPWFEEMMLRPSLQSVFGEMERWIATSSPTLPPLPN